MQKLLLLFIALSATTGLLLAQDPGKKATIHFRHASLRQAFTELEKQYGLNFSYNETNIAMYDKDINFLLKDVTASQVLNKIFAGSPLTWSFKGNLVVLTADPGYQKKPGAAHAASEILTGSITDSETGEPLAGVTVAGSRAGYSPAPSAPYKTRSSTRAISTAPHNCFRERWQALPSPARATPTASRR
jgi:hypothetical protein